MSSTYSYIQICIKQKKILDNNYLMYTHIYMYADRYSRDKGKYVKGFGAFEIGLPKKKKPMKYLVESIEPSI